ncbi:hypothetical protein [Microlunatus sp. Gsoil 973]|uniref:hypothetical protein n=1 Tax=Microlunatus sp. Gsoil 973 TaxID=2672569 RepID=UPI0018A80723|nr:hypothetical protein [Microlunatus sp. Gsoil 973]
MLSTIALGLVLLVLILQGLRGAAPSADPALARDLAAIALGMIAVGSIALIGRWPWPALLLALVAAVGFTGMATRPDAYNTVIGGVVVIGLPLILGGLLRRRPASIALGSCLAAIVLMGLVADATGVGTYGAADTCQEVLSSLALAVGAWSAGRVLRRGSTAAWTRTLRTAVDPLPVLLPDAGELVLQASALGLRPTMIRVEPLPDGGSLEPRSVDVVRNVLREGLSNAARHAPGADLTISMLADGAAVRIDVVNGPVSGEAGQARGSGRGIPTLAQRVAAVGGMLWVGPASGGFALRARVPLTRLPQLRNDDHDRLLDTGANPDR